MTDCKEGHELKIDIYRSRDGHMGVRIGCKRACPFGLGIQEAESMLDAYPQLERQRDSALRIARIVDLDERHEQAKALQDEIERGA